VTLVELKDIQLPDNMKRAMARQAEAERGKRAKIINAEGESLAAAALGAASDIMMEHPLALQLRNLQSLVEIGVDKNTTVGVPAPLMSTIGELGSFLARETAAAREQVEQELLAQRLAGWQEKYPDVKVRRVLAQGRPDEQLLEHAAGAQLVVVGSRGAGGFSGMLLGSTSQALIRHATCPLLVVRPVES
jgi:nucleotide-binding universal stress UspA family protein